MTNNVRLTLKEQEQLRKKAVEINKILIGKGQQPLTDSKLIHKILEKSIPAAKVGESGEIIIDPP